MTSEFEGPVPKEKFDHSVLENYSEGDAEFESDLIKSYMTSVMEHLPKLADSLKEKDSKNSILHSHDIKGSSSYIGAEVVRFMSGKIEAYCKEDKLEEAEKFYSDLKCEVDEVFKLLNSHLASIGYKLEDQPEAAEPTTQEEEEQQQQQENNNNKTESPTTTTETETTDKIQTSVADSEQVELLEKKEAAQSKDDLVKQTNYSNNNKTATEESPLSATNKDVHQQKNNETSSKTTTSSSSSSSSSKTTS